MLDLAIINGTMVDGTGREPERADIGVQDGRIVMVNPSGTLPAATHTVDAASRVVTPGFVDPHTHMDAQLWWDASGAPSILHGVTSVVIGSCGFGVAPLRPGTEEYVLRSLESVEEIPYTATKSGVPMSWKSWGQFFTQLGEQDLGVNVAGFVPHSALRIAALGDDARHREADANEVRTMRAALEEALGDGAVGFSTSRGSNHTDAFGEPMTSRSAGDEEMAALVAACAGRIWQINLRSKADPSPEGLRAALEELATYVAWSEAGGARLTWTPLVAPPGDTTAWRTLLEHADAAGKDVFPQVSAQAINGTIRFNGPSQAGIIDGWERPFAGYGSLSDQERRTRLAEPEFRNSLRDLPQNCGRSTGPCFDRWRVAISPSAPEVQGMTVSEYGTTVGGHAVDALLDLALSDDLATVIEAPMSNLDPDAVRSLATSPRTIFGIGDAGAHVNSITNFTYPTHVLASLVRDQGWFTLGQGVARLTSQPADAFGLTQRGRIREGNFADLCVVDLEHLGVGPASVLSDLPGGASRLHRAAHGYSQVIVNGVVTVENDRLLDSRAGMLLRV
jgi:N-acyl-D-amino-acid deacylase